MSGDAYHITSPSVDGDGGYRAMQSAINMANILSLIALIILTLMERPHS